MKNVYALLGRFGFGVTESDLELSGENLSLWLYNQLSPQASVIIESVPDSARSLMRMVKYFQERRRKPGGVEAVKSYFKKEIVPDIKAQIDLRLNQGATTPHVFKERLALFYANHFTVSRPAQRVISGSCLGYENETVRHHLDGNFESMLLAVESHPVMLAYLDNFQSAGPDSVLGKRRGRGLNENLAREILELHTVGVQGGYQQTDVLALAKIITGWSVFTGRFGSGELGRFKFYERMHEPGTQNLLGKAYRNVGVQQGQSALSDLAHHPATARFLATKLVTHFIDDVPPEKAVAHLENRFIKTGGHLPAVHQALLELPEARDRKYRKLKTPNDLLVSTMRALAIDTFPRGGAFRSLGLMNQVPYTAPSPAGWPEAREHWGSPSAIKQRVEWGMFLGERMGSQVNAHRLAKVVLPSHAKAAKTTVARAASAGQGLGLLLGSPDFQWRVS